MGASGSLPVRLVQQPAEVGPGPSHHDSPNREGNLLWHGPHQCLHLLQHGPGVWASKERGCIQGGPAHGQGGPGVLLLHQCQEPAEQRTLACRAPQVPPSRCSEWEEGVGSAGSVMPGQRGSSQSHTQRVHFEIKVPVQVLDETLRDSNSIPSGRTGLPKTSPSRWEAELELQGVQIWTLPVASL